MRLTLESDLDGAENRRLLEMDAPESQSFVHAALFEHKKYADPLESDALVNATGHEPHHYEVVYINPPSGEWVPPSIRVDFDVSVGTIAEFFGPEITDETPHLRLVARGPRGDSGFYPAEIAFDLIRNGFEIYGYVVAGLALVQFAARRRAGVPFEAVHRWKNTGKPDDELVRFVQRQPEWTATSLANLLESSPEACRSLLELCGFRPITENGLWWRTPDEAR